jgi:serine/threonine protein kinase
MGTDARASEQRSPEDLLGTVLGTCTLERILGRGGMGVVYLAQQSRPHRQVAVKALLLSLLPDPERRSRFLQRFRREADAVAQLDHPNILPIYEYGEQTDLAYLVMPYVTGGTLRDRVERKGQLPFPEVAGFLAQMAGALDYAHAHGVIHRDVKPQNMLLYPDKRLMLSDFGIAKVAEQAAADEDAPTLPQLTTMGHVVGTPDYIAPEQAMGQQVDTRADIYSLGVVLFYLVTGRVPFVGAQPMTVAAKHVSEPPPSPRQFRPDLPPAAERVILKAMAKNPDERYRTAGELAQAFRAALPKVTVPVPGPGQNQPPPKVAGPAALYVSPPPKHDSRRAPQTPLVGPAGTAGNTPPKRRWLAIGAVLLILILVAGGAYAAINSNLFNGTPTPTATTAPTPTPTPTRTATPTPTPSPTATVTGGSPVPSAYQAEQLLPQQSDLPQGTTLLSPQTVTTPDGLHGLPINYVIDPTQGEYNWQKGVFVEVDQNGSAYLKISIEQFAQATDAQNYYGDVLKHLKNTQQHPQIGQQAVDGFCCDNDATSYNVLFQDQNIVVLILAEASSAQSQQDSLSVAANMDKHVHPSQALRLDLWLADLQPRGRAAA